MNQKHQTIEIRIIQEKVRDANSHIDAMSADSFRQKNEEVTELWQQVEIHKTMISELQRKQDLTNNLLLSLQTRITALEEARGLVDEEDASTGVERRLNLMKGEMIDMEERMFAEYMQKEDLAGMESLMERVINEFIDGVNVQLQNTH